MNRNLYYIIRNLYEAGSQCKRIINATRVLYGYMSPQQMTYDTANDELIKHILFGW